MPASLQAILLGIVQGLTEFLPVSSSGHLILARAFFGYDSDRFGLPFDVAVHLGTALAIVAFFREDIARMLGAVPRALSRGPLAKSSEPDGASDRGARMIWLLLVGTLPVVLVGLLFEDLIEEHLRTPVVVAVTLTLGAIGFLVAERVGAQERSDASLTLAEALLLGAGQSLALVPGVSRSGITITVALLIGLRRVEAARFIFLLGVPAIIGAAVKELPALAGEGGGEAASLMLIGIGSSAVVGYLAIRFFVGYMARHSLDVFAWYRLALAATVIVWLFAGGGA
ncbi:MAG: undecaprenyl-diphosphate phosphatase [Vicinamibacterales bacterium]